MTVLDSHLYGNPQDILERKQQRQIMRVQQCGECINAKMIFGGEPKCTVRYQTFGYRCDHFTKADKND